MPACPWKAIYGDGAQSAATTRASACPGSVNLHTGVRAHACNTRVSSPPCPCQSVRMHHHHPPPPGSTREATRTRHARCLRQPPPPRARQSRRGLAMIPCLRGCPTVPARGRTGDRHSPPWPCERGGEVVGWAAAPSPPARSPLGTGRGWPGTCRSVPRSRRAARSWEPWRGGSKPAASASLVPAVRRRGTGPARPGRPRRATTPRPARGKGGARGPSARRGGARA